MEEKKDYQDAYEKEHYKAVYLANRVAELEDQVDDLQFQLNQSDLESVRPCQKVHAFCDPPEGPFEKLRQPVGRDCKGTL